MTAADGRYGRPADRWPDHLSLHTDPIDRRRASRPTATPQPAPRARPAAQQPPRQSPRPSAQRPAPQRPVPWQSPQQSSDRRPTPAAQSRTGRPPVPTAGLTAPQLRRRWIGVVTSVVLAGLMLPVQLGAVAVEALEILSPGPDGSALAMILAAMAAQVLALLPPMLLGPKAGGFTHRWRARMIVLSANAGLVAILALIGWARVGQS